MTNYQNDQMFSYGRVNVLEHLKSKGWSQVNLKIKPTSESFKPEDEEFINIHINEIGNMPISSTFEIIEESDDEIVLQGHYIIAAEITRISDPVKARPSDHGRCLITINKN